MFDLYCVVTFRGVEIGRYISDLGASMPTKKSISFHRVRLVSLVE